VQSIPHLSAGVFPVVVFVTVFMDLVAATSMLLLRGGQQSCPTSFWAELDFRRKWQSRVTVHLMKHSGKYGSPSETNKSYLYSQDYTRVNK
jgi:hypothetical protein